MTWVDSQDLLLNGHTGIAKRKIMDVYTYQDLSFTFQ